MKIQCKLNVGIILVDPQNIILKLIAPMIICYVFANILF